MKDVPENVTTLAAPPELTPIQTRRLKPLQGVAVGSLLVHEIYASIQGESTYAGLPCTFVRLTGCHLRCRWCDSPHAFAQGTPLAADDILRQVQSFAPNLVEITGGEPLAQPDVVPLMTRLADAGYKVLLETSGSLPIDQVDRRVAIILDMKCPGSGESQANCYANLDRLKTGDEVKFVIADRADFEWAVDLTRKRDLLRFPVLFAPVFGELDYATLCDWILETGLPIRFQPQVHKHVWAPTARGV